MIDSKSNTLFFRLEGPLQSWGDTSKFVIRRSMEAPTKSGVLGLICCAMGWSRLESRNHLSELNTLMMGVRIDRPSTRWWDYHTVGAGIGMTTASGGLKTGAQGTVIKRLEYLADASFLVTLQGDADLIKKIAETQTRPQWPLYLGRKSCPPSLPVFIQPRRGMNEQWTNPMAINGGVKAALQAVPWCPRYECDAPRDQTTTIQCLIEWRKMKNDDMAPDDAEVWYDTPLSFDPPVHHPRLVIRDRVTVQAGKAMQQPTPAPPRPRAGYHTSKWQNEIAPARRRFDQDLCVFCKQQASSVHHVSYRHAGGEEHIEQELRSLCRLCHDAVTMIEYGHGMEIDRIDPCDPRWREEIFRTRSEILRFRSEEGRRRALRGAPEKVRKELLEETD